MVRRVNECQCVNTGAILLLRLGDVYRWDFFSSYKWKMFVLSKAHGKGLIITLEIQGQWLKKKILTFRSSAYSAMAEVLEGRQQSRQAAAAQQRLTAQHWWLCTC